jgi:polysaccharide deacetylase family protein (PEP-CTERM system associated)
MLVSIDVEDWPQSTWDRTLPITRRAADNTLRLLDILSGLKAKTTMFVLGKFADAFPKVVAEIHGRGHEVACHGYGHIEVFRMSRAEFGEDVAKAKDGLEQIIGEAIHGYRAPDFSIVHSSLWALDVLAERGFRYDSSIFPVRTSRYGIAKWPQGPVTLRLANGASLVEFPIGSLRLLGRNWPLGGGGYHRLLPGLVNRVLTRRAIARRPFVFYCHPYELDTEELHDEAIRIPLRVRLHQGFGRGRFQGRFTALVKAFGSQRIIDCCESTTWPSFDFGLLAEFDKKAPV